MSTATTLPPVKQFYGSWVKHFGSYSYKGKLASQRGLTWTVIQIVNWLELLRNNPETHMNQECGSIHISPVRALKGSVSWYGLEGSVALYVIYPTTKWSVYNICVHIISWLVCAKRPVCPFDWTDFCTHTSRMRRVCVCVCVEARWVDFATT